MRGSLSGFSHIAWLSFVLLALLKGAFSAQSAFILLIAGTAALATCGRQLLPYVIATAALLLLFFTVTRGSTAVVRVAAQYLGILAAISVACALVLFALRHQRNS
jgi:hypothetical protein